MFGLAYDLINECNDLSSNTFQAAEQFLEKCKIFDSASIYERVWTLYGALAIVSRKIPISIWAITNIEKYLGICIQAL